MEVDRWWESRYSRIPNVPVVTWRSLFSLQKDKSIMFCRKKSNLPGGETPHIKLKGFPVSIIEGLKLKILVSDLFKSRTVLPEELH